MKIGLIVGSLRKDSFNRKVAEVVQGLFPAGVQAEFIDITNLPFYNADLDGDNPHPEYARVREELKKYDGYIFFTPEYNRSYAPAAKNVIDLGSLDPKGSPWNGKPAAVFSASVGTYGAMAANQALRQVFINTNLIPYQSPEVYLARIGESFDENGNMIEDTRAFLQEAVYGFVKFSQGIQNI
ncbi:MAG: NAD(P)H-dependent oxidoreductase [Tissierellia bacterium]|nr:NAD(P)H-dependent oxidoreductase [Tissierellia bacterium]